MSIKSDKWIREQAMKHGMIEPFSEKQMSKGCISYGLSSYGYDLRVSNEFKIFTNVNSAIIDPKAFDERSFVTVEADSPKFVCTCPLDRILPHPARCPHDLRRQIHIRALRHHRERHAV